MRYVAIAAAGAILLVFAGCGGGAGSTSSGSVTQVAAPPAVTQPAAPPAVTTTTTTTTTAAAPDAGTTLYTGEYPNGGVDVVSGGSGFTVVNSIQSLQSDDDDDSSITAYDATGEELSSVPSGEFTGICGAADVLVPGKGRLILTEHFVSTPAQGVNAGTSKLTLDAWNAADGSAAWSVTVTPKGASDCTTGERNEDLDSFVVTTDGRWGHYGLVVDNPDGIPDGVTIDMRDGTVQHQHQANGVIGNAASRDDGAVTDPVVKTIDPTTGATLGRFTDIDFIGGEQLAPPGVFDSDSAGTSPPAGTAWDGKTLFALKDSDDVDDVTVAAYSLPSARELWSKRLASPMLLGEGGGVLVVSKVTDPDESTSALVGLDGATGEQRWKLPEGTVCAITSSQLLLAVNGQLATIDLQDGKQLSYEDPGDDAQGVPDDDPDEPDCPSALRGGIEWTQSDDTVTVTQLLKP